MASTSLARRPSVRHLDPGPHSPRSFLLKYAATYADRRTAVVLSSVTPLLYWRRDYFAALNLTSPPSTWEELLAVAAALNGTDLNGDGQPDAALCCQLDECVDSGTLLSNILASMTQYEVRAGSPDPLRCPPRPASIRPRPHPVLRLGPSLAHWHSLDALAALRVSLRLVARPPPRATARLESRVRQPTFAMSAPLNPRPQCARRAPCSPPHVYTLADLMYPWGYTLPPSPRRA